MKTSYLRFWLLKYRTSAFAPVMLIMKSYAEKTTSRMDRWWQCEYQGLMDVDNQLKGLRRKGARQGASVNTAAASCFQQACKLLGRDLPRGWCKSLPRCSRQRTEESWSHGGSLTALHCCPVTLLSYCWAAKTEWGQRRWASSLCEGR